MLRDLLGKAMNFKGACTDSQGVRFLKNSLGFRVYGAHAVVVKTTKPG